MEFTAHKTTLKLGNEKPTNFESDYRSNYPEHPINPQNHEYDRLNELKEKLRKTNFELDQIGNETQHKQSMYQEDYGAKQSNNPEMQISQQDHQNLQKTNFMLGGLSPEQQRQIYQSETSKNFVNRPQNPDMIHQNLKNPNLES